MTIGLRLSIKDGSSRSGFASLAITILIALGLPAIAQVPVHDRDTHQPKAAEKRDNTTSEETKQDTKTTSSGINCTIGQRENARRMGRSPQDAYNEEQGNVALIRRYAQHYGVALNLALAVAYHESRFDTCAGSPTGVRGVMQLTQRTGRSLGFDRNINEENIEGGMRYLSMAVARCGAENYSCLAAFYNGSTPGEQLQWANGVRRGVPIFGGITGDQNGIPTAPERAGIVRTPVIYGSRTPAGSASGNDVAAANAALAGLNRLGWLQGQNRTNLESDQGAAGTADRHQDSWDQNARQRLQNAGLFNQAIDAQTLFATLLAGRLIDTLTRQSQTSGSLQYDPSVSNPFVPECGTARGREGQPCWCRATTTVTQEVCPVSTASGSANR